MIRRTSSVPPGTLRAVDTGAPAEREAGPGLEVSRVALAPGLGADRLEKLPARLTAQPHHAPPPPGAATGVASSGPLPEVQRHRVGGLSVVSYGDSPAALDEIARAIAAVTQNPDIAAAMRREKVTVVIVPANRQLTDLPEFAELRGQHTFDGRPWDEVRGVGGVRLDDGRLAVGIPEENLVSSSQDPYPDNYDVALHELAHVVQDYCLDHDDQRAIARLYRARKDAGLPFTDSYAAANDREYFAQATNLYFGRNQGQGINDPAWLTSHDPELRAVLARIFPSSTWPETLPRVVEPAPPPAHSLLGLLRNNGHPGD